jgi:hypothetical protein
VAAVRAQQEVLLMIGDQDEFISSADVNESAALAAHAGKNSQKS